MKLLCIAGSSRSGSKNNYLLQHIVETLDCDQALVYAGLEQLPLFHADMEDSSDARILKWRMAIDHADILIFSTPEYIHNIPASLKNALEWLTKTGELVGKKTLAIVYTPHAPRGAKAMVSLLYSLKALDADVVASLLLHHTDIAFDEDGKLNINAGADLLKASIDQLMA